MKLSNYLQETEHAVKQLFNALQYYQELLDKIKPSIFVDNSQRSLEEKEVEFSLWTQENKIKIKKSFNRTEEYLGLSFSQATLCGSILQIAAMGISLYSDNETIPESCKQFVTNKGVAKKYCIGRSIDCSLDVNEEFELPIGIIIYAGRNQYNHWDDDRLRQTNKSVFGYLANRCASFKNPAFDLSNPSLDIYSGNILAVLEWHTYEDYLGDMKELLEGNNRR